MSKSEFFSTGTVKYPAKEEAMAFSDGNGLPVSSAVIGVTYPYSDYYIRRAPDGNINDMEYILAGEGELNVGGEWVRAHAGDTYIFRAGERQEYRADRRKPWKKLWINFTCDYIDAFFDAYGIQSGVYKVDTRAYFETMLALSRSGQPYNQICFNIADCIHAVIGCAAMTVRRERNDGLRQNDASLIRETLAAAVYEKVGLDEIADRLHMSKSNLIRTFKREYNVTPYEFLLNAKIDAAKLLLKNTRMTVAEIADRICVSDEHYFSAMFLKRVGKRPGAYRLGI